MEILTEDWLLARMMFLIPMIFSLTVHEWAHAWSAWKLGDDTAQREGRLTLNPLAHMDPLGTLLLPLLGVPIGWAKPVPINMGKFHHSVGLRCGILLTVGAGPVSNICLAILSAAGLLVAALLFGGLDRVPISLHTLLDTLVFLNTMLAVFNLLPVPPLDGSRIVDCLLPDALRPAWDGFRGLGHMVLIVILLLLLVLCGANCLCLPMGLSRDSVETMVRHFAG
jgi:Zn-dependent protease